MKSILDPTFHYVPSVQTDLKKTFLRIRREMEKAKADKAKAQNRTTVASGPRVISLHPAREVAQR